MILCIFFGVKKYWSSKLCDIKTFGSCRRNSLNSQKKGPDDRYKWNYDPYKWPYKWVFVRLFHPYKWIYGRLLVLVGALLAENPWKDELRFEKIAKWASMIQASAIANKERRFYRKNQQPWAEKRRFLEQIHPRKLTFRKGGYEPLVHQLSTYHLFGNPSKRMSFRKGRFPKRLAP